MSNVLQVRKNKFHEKGSSITQCNISSVIIFAIRYLYGQQTNIKVNNACNAQIVKTAFWK